MLVVLQVHRETLMSNIVSRSRTERDFRGVRGMDFLQETDGADYCSHVSDAKDSSE